MIKTKIIAWLQSNSSDEIKANEIKYILNEFSKDFCHWVNCHYYYNASDYNYIAYFINSEKRYNISELLQMFEKEKGL